jgi:hypothetical protein
MIERRERPQDLTTVASIHLDRSPLTFLLGEAKYGPISMRDRQERARPRAQKHPADVTNAHNPKITLDGSGTVVVNVPMTPIE